MSAARCRMPVTREESNKPRRLTRAGRRNRQPRSAAAEPTVKVARARRSRAKQREGRQDEASRDDPAPEDEARSRRRHWKESCACRPGEDEKEHLRAVGDASQERDRSFFVSR